MRWRPFSFQSHTPSAQSDWLVVENGVDMLWPPDEMALVD
jgi:hypothetical protein